MLHESILLFLGWHSRLKSEESPIYENTLNFKKLNQNVRVVETFPQTLSNTNCLFFVINFKMKCPFFETIFINISVIRSWLCKTFDNLQYILFPHQRWVTIFPTSCPHLRDHFLHYSSLHLWHYIQYKHSESNIQIALIDSWPVLNNLRSSFFCFNFLHLFLK